MMMARKREPYGRVRFRAMSVRPGEVSRAGRGERAGSSALLLMSDWWWLVADV
jgi:hypothetical protein